MLCQLTQYYNKSIAPCLVCEAGQEKSFMDQNLIAAALSVYTETPTLTKSTEVLFLFLTDV